MSKHTATISVNGGNDRIAALAALYQGEKTDASYLFNTAMAMMGIAVSYVVGAIAFLGNPSRGPMPWLFLLLLPIPLWLIVAFHSLMTLNAMSHGISVRIIEDALFDASELRVDRGLVGSAAGDKIMDITQEKVVHKVTTFVVYAGVAGLVIGFTVYALYSAQGIVKDDLVWILAIGAYSLLLIMVAASWIVGVRMINKGRKEIPEPPKSSGASAS
jgi:hypothetical protein